MVKYREILRLRHMGVSQRNVAHSCECSRKTVQTVEHKARSLGLAWPLPEEITDEALRKVLFGKRGPSRSRYPIDHKRIAEEMRGKHMTLTLCWNEYCEEAMEYGKQPYQYSTFCDLHYRWKQEHGYSMHIRHKPAERIEVDWAGDVMRYVDPDTGEELKAFVFVACLPFSQFLFAKAYKDMKETSWIKAHIDAFGFFGGTCPLIVPDNCKTGVIKNTLDELVINEQYRKMTEYYGCAVVPARPARPKDKPSVEGSVGLVERQAMAPLRHEVFLSLDELNEALAGKVSTINSRPFQKRDGSRQSEFEKCERPSLVPLPAMPFRIVIRSFATVQFNYHILFDGMYYSVPFTYLRKEVAIEATETSVAILYEGKRIAIHERKYGTRGQYTTNPEHMPDAHRDFAEWNGDRFRRWARDKGDGCARVIDSILRSRTVEQQAYRSCRALLDLGRRYDDALLETACEKALEYTPTPSYKTVKNILVKLEQERPTDPNAYAYLRGSEYFGKE